MHTDNPVTTVKVKTTGLKLQRNGSLHILDISVSFSNLTDETCAGLD